MKLRQGLNHSGLTYIFKSHGSKAMNYQYTESASLDLNAFQSKRFSETYSPLFLFSKKNLR